MAGVALSPMSEYLSHVRVDDVPTERGEVVTVLATDSLESGFQKLVDHNVLSAPVWDDQRKVYTGFLDMKDLVSVVVFVADQQAKRASMSLRDMLRDMPAHLYPTDGVTVTYLSRTHPLRTVKTGTPLLEVAKMMAQRVYRVAIVDEQNRILKIVSQSAVVKFVNDALLRVAGDSARRSVGSFNMAKKVISVPATATALETFRTLDQHNIRGCAVLDAHGHLVGVCSSRDLKRFIRAPNFAALDMPILDFLKIIRAEEIDEHMPTVAVTAHDPFSLAIGKLAATRLHHLYVVADDKSFRPTAVVSLTDVLRVVTQSL